MDNRDNALISLNGTYTVEAAVVLPFLILVIWSFIFMSFFLYNRVTISQYASMAALEGANLSLGNNVKLQQETQELALSYMADGLVLIKDTKVTTYVNGEKVTVEIDASMDVPAIIGGSDLFSNRYFDIHVKKSAKRRREPTFIHVCNTIYRTTQQ